MRKVFSIQAIRAVAAALVVFFHARFFVDSYQATYGFAPALFFDFGVLRRFGGFGVDLFFVVSGFVVLYTTWHAPRTVAAMRAFIGRRLARIVPIYWLYTVFLVALAPRLFGQTMDFASVALSLLFIPYKPTGGNFAPILAVGWSLSYEMYFYILAALGLLLPRGAFIAGLGVYFAVCVLAPFFLPPLAALPAMMTNALVLEFYFGMLICAAYLRFGGIGRRVGWGALAVGIGLLALAAGFSPPPEAFRGFVWGIPAAGVVVWFISRERQGGFWEKPLWQALGASSYSLYLTHFILLPALGRLGFEAGLMPYLPADVYMVVTGIVCVVVGHGLYLGVERPLGRGVAALFARGVGRERCRVGV